jgi:DNA-binding IclR family transcriptional regulator
MSSTVDRISQIIDLLAQSPGSTMSAADVAKELNQSRSAVTRQLDLLVDAGIAIKDRTSRNYGLSLRLYHWGVKVVTPRLPSASIRHEMANLAMATRRMISYTVLEGATSIMLEQTRWSGEHAVVIPFESRSYWTQTASGMAIAAFLPTAELDKLMEVGGEVASAFQIEPPTELQARLQEVRGQGFSSRVGVGRVSFACPIIDHSSDQPIAALGISIPDPEESDSIIRAIKDAAFRCSFTLDGRISNNGF